MRRPTTSIFASAICFVVTAGFVALLAGPAQAAIVTTGDVTPADSSTWTNNTSVTIGNTADGTVSFTNGSTLGTNNPTGLSNTVNLATTFGVTGTLNVDGAGSTWRLGSLNAGTSSIPQVFAGGTGIINITNGGSIFAENAGVSIGGAFNSMGILTVASGGKLNRLGCLGCNALSTGIATVDGAGSTVGGANTQGVEIGASGKGYLTIVNGATVTGIAGPVANQAGSFGRVIVDGTGSTWATGSVGPQIGIRGTGQAILTNGAALIVGGSVQDSQIGQLGGAVGTALIHGTGTTWADGRGIYVGGAGTSGSGRLSVSDGATVTANAFSINSSSIMTVDLGTGSSVVSTGAAGVANGGAIRMAAKATATNGNYTPISATTWTGAGTVQALGGVYNAATHSVTVSSAATGQAGTAVTIDRATTQRILITDSATGQQVGASFQAAIAPANLSLTASLMNTSQLSLLQGLLDPGKAILSGWDFSATGYTAGDPIYLSLQIGGGQKFYDLDVWHFDGTSWGKYLNTDLAYDNTFASFVATGFSGYAVSGLAAVPVPAAIWLFGSGLAAMVGFARRSMKNREASF